MTLASQIPDDPIKDLLRRITNLERNQQQMQSRQVDSGTMQSPNFDGNASTNTVGSAGYGLDGPSGNAVFNNIALRGGIIGNTALTTPVVPVAANASATGASVASGSFVTAATTTITVPTGFTTLAIIGVGTSFGFNASGGAGLCHVTINGVAGNDGYGFVSGAGNAGATGILASVITGLSGGTVITLTCVFGGAGTGTWTSVAGTISALGNWGR